MEASARQTLVDCVDAAIPGVLGAAVEGVTRRVLRCAPAAHPAVAVGLRADGERLLEMAGRQIALELLARMGRKPRRWPYDRGLLRDRLVPGRQLLLPQ